MPSLRQGSIHLFRFSGIDVYVHWWWFLVAVFEINARNSRYTSLAWNAAEYLSLFVIVLLHEFGHSLACRQVGGIANRIVLWPLGGVAYVDPPPRPGATLWSIAAGPLVNVALFPVFGALYFLSGTQGTVQTIPNLHRLLFHLLWIDGGLFVFNMLPIYPLDGGQILRALLWFMMGRARSLLVVTILGFVGVIGLFGLALWVHSTWYGILAFYMLVNCWGGLRHAQTLLRFARAPRHNGFSCPECKEAPPIGIFWKCSKCGQSFDTFESQSVCRNCGAQYPVTQCLDCGRAHPMSEWMGAALAPSKS